MIASNFGLLLWHLLGSTPRAFGRYLRAWGSPSRSNLHRNKVDLRVRRLEEEAAWIERYRQLWDARFDELDKAVEELRRKGKVDGRKKRE
jgi:hypothetical protein